jgi:hypothetical protein
MEIPATYIVDPEADAKKAERAALFRERLAKAKADREAAGIAPPPRQPFNPIEKARNNPNSLSLAIKAKCWDCQAGDDDPHPRWRIGNCTAPDCPLYPHRPYRDQMGKPTPASLMTGAEE